MSEHMTESPLISMCVGKQLRKILTRTSGSFLSYPGFMSIDMNRNDKKEVTSAIFVYQRGDDEKNVIITMKWVGDRVHWAFTELMDEAVEQTSEATAAVLCFLMHLIYRAACLYDESKWWLQQYELYPPVI